jgi:hypothetical protein
MTDKRNKLLHHHLTCELFLKFNRNVLKERHLNRRQEIIYDTTSLVDNQRPFQESEEMIEEIVQAESTQDGAESELFNEDQELAAFAEEFEEEMAVIERDPFWSSSSAKKNFNNSVETIINSDERRTRRSKGSFNLIFSKYFLVHNIITILTFLSLIIF